MRILFNSLKDDGTILVESMGTDSRKAISFFNHNPGLSNYSHGILPGIEGINDTLLTTTEQHGINILRNIKYGGYSIFRYI